MTAAESVRRAGTRLADVVQQHGDAQQGVALDRCHSVQGVSPNVIAMMLVSLLKIKGLAQLRDHGGENIAERIKNRQNMLAADSTRIRSAAI